MKSARLDRYPLAAVFEAQCETRGSCRDSILKSSIIRMHAVNSIPKATTAQGKSPTSGNLAFARWLGSHFGSNFDSICEINNNGSIS